MASAFSVSSLLNEQQHQQHDRPATFRRPRPAVLDISHLLNTDEGVPALSPTRTPSPMSVSSGSGSAAAAAASGGYPFPLPSIADTLPGMLPSLASSYPSMPKPHEPESQHAYPALPSFDFQRGRHCSNSSNSSSGSSGSSGTGLWMHDSMASSVSSLASNASCSSSSTSNEQSSAVAAAHHSDEEPASSSAHPSPVKAKRRRANAKQLEVLNRVFERTVFPSTQLRAELGRQLGMSPRTVQIWFQNRRQAIRTRERQRLLRIVRDDQQASSPCSGAE